MCLCSGLPHLRTFGITLFLVLLRPDGIGTVTVEEKERFEEIKERLRVLLENQITHFRLEPSCRTHSQVLSRSP